MAGEKGRWKRSLVNKVLVLPCFLPLCREHSKQSQSLPIYPSPPCHLPYLMHISVPVGMEVAA